jgi:two-component system, cell cycle sensor histidine kinase and response regulator CckA
MKDKPVILIVDDQPQNIELLEAYLVPQGYEIVKAANGEEALGKLSGNQIDLILLDVIMPGVDGFEVTRRVRQDDKHRLIPIILVTVLRETGDRVKGIQAGCDDFISMPVDKIELLARVRSLLKVKAYNDLMSNYRKELEAEVNRRTEELKHTFIFQQRLIDALPVPIFYKDSEGRYLGCNSSFEKFFGQKREQVTGKSVYELFPKEFADIYHEKDLVLLQNPGIQIYESAVKDTDGVVHNVIFHKATFLNMDGSVGGLIGAILDITDRKRAEEVLRSEREKLEMVTQNMGAGLALISKDYRTLWANNILKQIFGDVEGKTCYSTYNQKAEICHGCGVREVFEKGSEKVVHEQVGKDIEGNTIWSEIIATPIKDKEGNITAALELVIPITERKRAEEEMVAVQEQFRQSQKMEAIGQLAGGIAHDFNNLLTVIKGYSQMTSMELKEGDPLKERIEQIKRAADRAADLIRQLLVFSRRQTLELKVIDLNTALRNLEKMLRRVIGEDIELVIHLPEDLGGVKTDPGQIEQVIMNLAVNAKDAMPSGGKLTIETANVELDEEYARNHVAVKTGGYVMLAVSDTGMGMTPEVRDRVFEPFFTTKEEGKGTGLGLSTVYGIVKQSGGNIWVYSELGKGTTFKIYFPRVDEPLDEISEKVTVRKGLLRGSETILVVEDEEEVRKLVVWGLEGQGYRVLDAPQGLDAFLIGKENQGPIHLLVTDVVMPKMSGRDLAERLASIRPGIKVLYMSGYTERAIAHKGILDKGINFIQKPFTVDELARKVREVLDK